MQQRPTLAFAASAKAATSLFHASFINQRRRRCVLTAVLLGLLALLLPSADAIAGDRELTLVVRVPQATLDENANQDVFIKMFARPLDREAREQGELELKVLSISPIVGGGGKARRYQVKLLAPDYVTKDRYALLAYVDGGNVVTESDEGAVDLTIELGQVTLPQRIVAGGRGVARFPVEIFNRGNVAVQRRQRVDLAIIARPAGDVDGRNDVVVAKLENESISGLAPKDSRKVVLLAEFPGPLEVKTYQLRAVVDTGDAVVESDEGNNTAVLNDTIAVSEQSVDLLVDISGANLPKGIVAGVRKSITVPVKVSNAGNLDFRGDEQVMLSVIARPAQKIMDEKADLVLATTPLADLADLTPGTTRTVEVEAQLPSNLPVDNYMLRVVVDPANVIKEANKANNTATLLDPIKVMALVVDLAGQFDKPRFPKAVIGGSSESYTVPIKVSNAGSVPFPAGQKMTLTLLLRPEDANDTRRDVKLQQIADREVSDLTPGRSITLTLDGNLPSNLATGSYKVLATIEPTPTLQDADETNNVLQLPDPLGIAAPFVDLAAQVEVLRPARALVAGSDALLAVPVKVTNAGNVPSPADAKVDIRIAARPLAKAGESDADVTLATLEGQSVGNLRPGATELYQARIKFPRGLAAGDYVLSAMVDVGAAVKESDKANNVAVSSAEQSIAIAAPVVDLSAELVNLDLPRSVIAGSGVKLKAPVRVTNEGNVPLLEDQQIDLRLLARRIVEGEANDKDVALTTLGSQSVASLAPGAAATFVLEAAVPANLTPGRYLLVALADSGDALKEASEKNNLAVAAPGQAVEVVAPFVDLALDLPTVNLPSAVVAGHGPAARLTLRIANRGNVPVAADQKVDVRISSRPVAAGAKADGDVALTTLSAIDLAGLAPGAAKTVDAQVTLPGQLGPGQYVLVAQLDPANIARDSARSNNQALTEAGSAMTVAAPFVDLAAALTDVSLPGAAIAGHAAPAVANLVLRNVGNIAAGDDAKVQVKLYARPADAGDKADRDVLLQTLDAQDMAGLGAAQSKTIKLSAALPATLSAGKYVLAVDVAGNPALRDQNAGNNRVVSDAAGAMAVAAPFVDLALSFGDVALPSAAIAGHAAPIKSSVKLTNEGNIAVPADSTAEIKLFAHPADANGTDKDVLLTTLSNQNIAGLGAGQSTTMTLSAELPATLAEGKYVLAAQLVPSASVKDTQANNHRAMLPVGNAIAVAAPFVDLALSFADAALPAAAIAGHAAPIKPSVKLTNQGNIAVPADSTAEIKLFAHPADAAGTDQDVLLTTLSGREVTGLAAGQSMTVPLTAELPATLAEGKYVLAAQLTPSTNVKDAQANNHRAILPAGNAIAVAAPFVDLALSFVQVELPESAIAGHAPAVKATVKLTNLGNIAVPADSSAEVKLLAHLADADSAEKDVLLTTLSGRDVSGLGAGQSVNLPLSAELPAALPAGKYQLAAQLAPSAQVKDQKANNHRAVASAAAGTMAVAAPFVDLVAELPTPQLPTGVIAGHGPSVTLTLNVTNRGNIATSAKQTGNVSFFARPAAAQAGNELTLAKLADQDLGNFRPGETRRFRAELSMPAALKAGRYVLGAALDGGSELSESDRTNNRAQLADEAALAVAAPFVDLTLALEANPGSEQRVAGFGPTVPIKLTVANAGNIAAPRGQQVNLTISAVPSAGGAPLELAALTGREIGELAPGSARSFAADVLLPLDAVGSFTFAAALTPVGELADSNADNNRAAAPAAALVKVVAPRIDLAVDLAKAELPQQAVAGHAAGLQLPVNVRNLGNVAFGADAKLDIRIFAQPTAGGDAVTLTQLDGESIAGMEPGVTKTFYARYGVPAGMTTGRYVLGAKIDAAGRIAEADEQNNEARTDNASAMEVVQPVLDLEVTLQPTVLPGGVVEGAWRGVAVVQVHNHGNIPTPDDAAGDIILTARSASRFKDNAQDFVLSKLTGQSLAGIAPGSSRSYRAEAVLSTSDLPTDDYLLAVQLELADGLRDANPRNNAARMPEGVIQLGERFRVKDMPVPFESDGPQRYNLSALKVVYPAASGKLPDLNALMELRVELTETYAGYVAQRHGEKTRKLRLADVAELNNARFYRSAVRQLCAVIAEHLEHNGVHARVRPAPDQVDRNGDDLRPAGQTELRLVVELE